MSNPQSVVTVEVVGGPRLTIPWLQSMTAQAALEKARDQTNSDTFNFALEYFGASLGYMVIMINGTFESFVPKQLPNFYWDFLVNGVSSALGIDSVKLNSGDTVTFRFDSYDPIQHANTTLAAKYKARTGGKSQS